MADDVTAAVERLRREGSIGMSEAVNELIRAGTSAPGLDRRCAYGDFIARSSGR